MHETLRENRHEIEENNKIELDQILSNHLTRKKSLLDAHQKEIRDMEKAHLDKISSLHEKFEHSLEKVEFIKWDFRKSWLHNSRLSAISEFIFNLRKKRSSKRSEKSSIRESKNGKRTTLSEKWRGRAPTTRAKPSLRTSPFIVWQTP